MLRGAMEKDLDAALFLNFCRGIKDDPIDSISAAWPTENASDKIEALAFRCMASVAVSAVRRDVDHGLQCCESPIERVFFAALLATSDSICESMDPPRIVFSSTRVGAYSHGASEVTICPQAVLGNRRVDFLLHYFTTFPAWDPIKKEVTIPGGVDREARLIVECDGHDFHEKTKEQAGRDKARDRELQSLGVPIFHFTGSEIWRDPIGCAKASLKHLAKAADTVRGR